jgi:hypothetical protein
MRKRNHQVNKEFAKLIVDFKSINQFVFITFVETICERLAKSTYTPSTSTLSNGCLCEALTAKNNCKKYLSETERHTI